MISDGTVFKLVEKYSLNAPKDMSDPRASVTQVVNEMKEKGLSNAVIAREMGIAESSVRSLLLRPAS